MTVRTLFIVALVALAACSSADRNEDKNGQQPENTPPVAQPQHIEVDAGEALEIVLAGSDADGDSLSFEVVDGPSHGTLEGTPPTLVYIPETDFSGEDSFTFRVSDGQANSKPAAVRITVRPEAPVEENIRPVANSQSLKTDQDTALSITLGGSDADGDGLSFRIVDEPEHGEVSGIPPQVVYTPNAGFTGSDSFTFVANDGSEDSEPATVHILIEAASIANIPPVADFQTLHALQSHTLEITLTGSDADGDPLEFRVIDGPEHGELEGEGELYEYTSSSDFYGQDQFTFVVNDGTEDSEPATVTIQVNARPLVEPLELETNQNTSLLITPQGSDPEGEALTFSILEDPKNGSLVEENAGWRYSPEPDFYGQDEFQYIANDGKQDSEPAVVTITVNARPIAEPLEFGTNQDTPLLITLQGNDPDGEALTFSILEDPKNGNLLEENAGWRYSPEPDFYGQDEFQYIANDGKSNSEPATVTITVNGQPTVNVESSALTTEDEPILIPVQTEDPDGDSLTLKVLEPPSNGTLATDSSGFTYTPSEGFYGTDSFEFVANDGKMDSEAASVSVRVRSRPRVDDLAVNVLVNGQVSITPSGRSLEDNAFTFQLVDSPSGDLDTSGPTWLYSPLEDFTGEDTFTYRATDEFGTQSLLATVSITVHSQSFQVSGFASGILTAGAELMLNGDERIELSSDGVFQFTTPVFPGESYKVKLMAEPTKQLCYLENAEGTVSEEMLDVSLHCRSWKEPVNFAPGGVGFSWSGDVEIAYNILGDGLAVWAMGHQNTDPSKDRPSSLWGAVYSASTDTWGAPSPISDDDPNIAVRNPQLLIADDGERWVFWEQCDDFPTGEDESEKCWFSLRASQMDADGQNWSAPMLVREPQGDILRYEAALSANSGQGRVVLVSYERDQGTEEDPDDTVRVISVSSGALFGEWQWQSLDTFPTPIAIQLLLSKPSTLLRVASSSGHVAALWAVDHNYFRHSRYTNNGWTSPYSEPSLSLASIGVAPNGDVLVIGRSTGASTNRNLVARWFRSPSGGELGEKEWDPERELLFQLEEGLSLLDNSLTIAPDSSVMVIWRIWEPPNAYRYMAIRHTESSGWLPVKEIEPTAGSSLVDLVADSEGNAFLYMSRFTNSIVLQYSKSSDSWDEINLATGSGADYAIALQPGGKATVLYRNKGDSNRIRMLRFD